MPEQNKFICEKCNRIFVKEGFFKKHKCIIKQDTSPHTCQYCNKEYKNESGLLAHSCSKQQRFLAKDEKSVRIGFLAYQLFYKISFNSKKIKDYSDFSKSHYYIDFCKFGKYVTNINAVEIEDFIRFLIKNTVPLKLWCQDEIYFIWVRALMKKESMETALERNILLMEQWAKEEIENWKDFFKKVNIVLAIRWIKSGRISPWLLYNSLTGHLLFDRFSEKDLKLVEEWLDPTYWNEMFIKNKDDVIFIRKMLREENV